MFSIILTSLHISVFRWNLVLKFALYRVILSRILGKGASMEIFYARKEKAPLPANGFFCKKQFLAA